LDQVHFGGVLNSALAVQGGGRGSARSKAVCSVVIEPRLASHSVARCGGRPVWILKLADRWALRLWMNLPRL